MSFTAKLRTMRRKIQRNIATETHLPSFSAVCGEQIRVRYGRSQLAPRPPGATRPEVISLIIFAGRADGCFKPSDIGLTRSRYHTFEHDPPFPGTDLRPTTRVVGARDADILGKFMKDSVVRGRLLQLLYERRSEDSIPFGQAEQAVPPPGGINRRDWLRAVAQLAEYHLIDWTPLEDQSGMGLVSGFARINDFGVRVLEGGVASPIRISVDESRRSTVRQDQQVRTAPATPQQQATTEALEKVIVAINQAEASDREKNEMKSLLRKLLASKAATKVLGPGAQSLAAKYFAQ